MILLLGGSGYVGEAFQVELRARGTPFRVVSRQELDYTHFIQLRILLDSLKPDFVINTAGFTGKPNVDACEERKADTLNGNSILPLTMAQACESISIPFGHVSSGCIFSGAKVREGSVEKIERDLTAAGPRQLAVAKDARLVGFDESDEPNFSFRNPPCSFYSGSKALAEENLKGFPKTYLWRLRIPFDEIDNARNYLSKIQRYERVYENVNSLSHRGDFVSACLDLWERRAPFGTYNVTNPGYVTTCEVVGMMESILKPDRKFKFWENDDEFYRKAARTPRSNCILDVSKLLQAGVNLRPVEAALTEALTRWKAAK